MTFKDCPIIPSINMVQTPEEFGHKLMKISFSHKVHLDISDGRFVPTHSFPKEVDFTFKHLHHFDYVEVHLMTLYPRHWINFLSSCTDLFIVHAELPDVTSQIKHIRSHKKKVGLAFRPETDIHDYTELIGKVDQIVILCIQPGPNGAAFISETLKTVTKLHKLFPNIPIECDGSMNEHTLLRAKSAGASTFVAGSALQKAKDALQKYEELYSIVK